ncbi:MAG TPA: hypothetical protein VFS43_22595 [Polyangiaceae bacterium]|nr:hypothetical protein [Polyangiaceae bacterium]
MARSYSALTLISVPRLSASTAMALGTELLTAGRQEPGLPPALAPALGQLERGLGALRMARRLQREAKAIDASVVVEADQVLDRTWSGFHDFLVGWTKLSDAPEAAERAGRARELIERVFPDGLRFLNFPYRMQWADSLMKLDRLGEPRLAGHVRALGGEAFVGAIARAHEAYGAALNLTRRKADVNARVRVRAPLDAFLEALRSYVLRVTNFVDENKGDEAARALGRRLLEPLTAWKGRGGGRKVESPEGRGAGGAGEREGPPGP